MDAIVTFLKEFDLHTILSIVAVVWFFNLRTEKKIDVKIDGLEKKSDMKFDALEKRIDVKIDTLEKKIDAKFDALEKKIDAKIDALEKRIDIKSDNLEKTIETIVRKVDNLTTDSREIQSTLNDIDIRLSVVEKCLDWFHPAPRSHIEKVQNE